MPISRQIDKYFGIHFSKGTGPKDVLNFLPAFEVSPVEGAPLVLIPMLCCGRTFTYETIDDIPTETTPCPCGADWSWVVKYEEKKDIAQIATLVLDVTRQIRERP